MTPDTYVYFIKQGLHVKIGFSNNPLKRLKTLQSASPTRLRLLAVIKGNLGLEAALHDEFKEFRLEGEWFLYTRAIRAYLKTAPKVKVTKTRIRRRSRRAVPKVGPKRRPYRFEPLPKGVPIDFAGLRKGGRPGPRPQRVEPPLVRVGCPRGSRPIYDESPTYFVDYDGWKQMYQLGGGIPAEASPARQSLIIEALMVGQFTLLLPPSPFDFAIAGAA